MKDEQVTYRPPSPALPDLPACFGEPSSPAEDRPGIDFPVTINISLTSIQIRFDTGAAHITYQTGVPGVGKVPSARHVTIPSSLLSTLISYASKEVKSAHV